MFQNQWSFACFQSEFLHFICLGWNCRMGIGSRGREGWKQTKLPHFSSSSRPQHSIMQMASWSWISSNNLLTKSLQFLIRLERGFERGKGGDRWCWHNWKLWSFSISGFLRVCAQQSPDTLGPKIQLDVALRGGQVWEKGWPCGSRQYWKGQEVEEKAKKEVQMAFKKDEGEQRSAHVLTTSDKQLCGWGVKDTETSFPFPCCEGWTNCWSLPRLKMSGLHFLTTYTPCSQWNAKPELDIDRFQARSITSKVQSLVS